MQSYCLWPLNRDLKQGRRRRLGERNKFAYSVGKNNSFARPARAFHILIHFFAVLVLTTTWNDQIWGHVEDESTWRRIFKFIFKCPHRSHQFYSWIAHSHFPSRTTWSNRKIITVTGNNIFRQRSRSRRRRPCLRSLICKFVTFSLPSPLSLLKLPIIREIEQNVYGKR